MSVLNMYPRLQLQASSVDDDNDDVDRHGASVGYGIAVVCVTILVFCVLVSSSLSVWKACASASLVALLLVVAACFAPKRWWFCRRSQRPGASAELVVTVVTAGGGRPGFPCPQVNVPPAFAFECPALEASGGGEGEPAPTAAVCCSVCLEDVRGGEMVRQLPACTHLFHVGCIDMWLHSHRTCPMCRCEIISPVAAVTPKAEAQEAPESLDDDDHDLPPV
ncbi:hypothetical protein SORBI_3004G114100 [Sorghum bicolor]|uniref:RING-type E3 ubiquitin transferase n=2 Tax=Sorghum bicolor TaxID=4558 RepID=C5XZG0_SORBI|nr:hypothetical protein SORBI_3004G114100 [Sorghum bicolor]